MALTEFRENSIHLHGLLMFRIIIKLDAILIMEDNEKNVIYIDFCKIILTFIKFIVFGSTNRWSNVILMK